MFIEEAQWINRILSSLQPDENNLVANLGSSTAYFRTIVQPHIHENIIKPLEKNGWKIVHVDLKKENGVDVVANVSDALFAKEYANFFSLTLCTNMLEHVKNISIVIDNLFTLTRKNGYVLITVPYKYRLHNDPIDNGFRPKPKEIVSLFEDGMVNVINEEIIRIDDKKYYPIKKSKFLLWGYRERIKYFFGIRFKVSSVLLQVIK